MKRLSVFMMMVAAGAMLCASPASVFAADKKPAKQASPVAEESGPITEGELAQWLVKVLGLSRFLPAAPTDFECIQILMQNNIAPKDGWNQDNTVTLGNLARVVVLALGRQGEVENPENDESWVNYLKSEGIDFGSAGEAMDNLEPLPQPVGPEAIVTSTDPLSKLSRINPPDNQQVGADLSTLGHISSRVIHHRDIPRIEQQISRRPGRHPKPPPMTPTKPSGSGSGSGSGHGGAGGSGSGGAGGSGAGGSGPGGNGGGPGGDDGGPNAV